VLACLDGTMTAREEDPVGSHAAPA
jgi:hypothetical protein